MENEKLKEIRAQLHVNQEELSKKLGITQSYYSALERGEKQITKKLLEKLFKNVGVSIQWWYSSNGDIFSSNLSGDNVGLDVGSEKSELLPVNYSHRLFKDLKKTDSEKYKLLKNLLLLSEFHDFIGDFENTYIGEVRKILYYQSIQTPGNKIPYRQYKENLQKALEKIEDYKPVLNKLESSIKQFYQEFQQFDTKNIIEDYYDASED